MAKYQKTGGEHFHKPKDISLDREKDSRNKFKRDIHVLQISPNLSVLTSIVFRN